jgi:hypothetical protein
MTYFLKEIKRRGLSKNLKLKIDFLLERITFTKTISTNCFQRGRDVDLGKILPVRKTLTTK